MIGNKNNLNKFQNFNNINAIGNINYMNNMNNIPNFPSHIFEQQQNKQLLNPNQIQNYGFNLNEDSNLNIKCIQIQISNL